MKVDMKVEHQLGTIHLRRQQILCDNADILNGWSPICLTTKNHTLFFPQYIQD